MASIFHRAEVTLPVQVKRKKRPTDVSNLRRCRWGWPGWWWWTWWRQGWWGWWWRWQGWLWRWWGGQSTNQTVDVRRKSWLSGQFTCQDSQRLASPSGVIGKPLYKSIWKCWISYHSSLQMTKPSPLKMMWIEEATDVKIFKEPTFIWNFLERKGSCQVCMKFANLQRNSSICMSIFFSVTMEEYLNTSIQVFSWNISQWQWRRTSSI